MTPQTKKSTATTKATAAPKTPVPNTEVSAAEAKQNREYIIIMITVAVVITIIGSFLTYKLFKIYVHRTDEIKAQQIYRDGLKKKKVALVQLDSNLKTIQQVQPSGLSTADVIYHALPTDPEVKTLLGYLENISAATGVKATISTSAVSTSSTSSGTSTAPAASGTTTASSTATSSGSTPQPYPFSISVTGPYDQVINFLKATEQSLRPMDFTSMTISGTSGTIQASLSFNTYYQGIANIKNKSEPLTEYLQSGRAN